MKNIKDMNAYAWSKAQFRANQKLEENYNFQDGERIMLVPVKIKFNEKSEIENIEQVDITPFYKEELEEFNKNLEESLKNR